MTSAAIADSASISGEPDGRLHRVGQQPRRLLRLLAAGGGRGRERAAECVDVVGEVHGAMAPLWHHYDVIVKRHRGATCCGRRRLAPVPEIVPLRVQVIAQTQFTPPADVPWETDADGGQALAEFAGRACYQSWDKPNPATATNAGLPAAHPRGRPPRRCSSTAR